MDGHNVLTPSDISAAVPSIPRRGDVRVASGMCGVAFGVDVPSGSFYDARCAIDSADAETSTMIMGSFGAFPAAEAARDHGMERACDRVGA